MQAAGRQWRGARPDGGSGAGSGSREEQAALPTVPGQRSAAPPGRRSLPGQMLPGGPGGSLGLPRQPRGLSAPSPSGGVPGSSGASAAPGRPRHRRLLCPFPGLGCAPAAPQGERCPARADPGAEQRRDPRKTRALRSLLRPPATAAPCGRARRRRRPGGRERAGMEKELARDSSPGATRVGSLPAGRPESGKFPRSDLS